MNAIDQKKALRRQFRTARRNLSEREQRRAQSQLCKQLIGNGEFLRARRVAFYLANDGEVRTQCALNYARKHGLECFLPVVGEGGELQMQLAPADARYAENQYGIPEPVGTPACAAWQLDLILVPLVAFDDRGNRLGMGGGYYDRLLSGSEHWPRRPRLLGVAHACQRAEALPVEAWDMPLNDVIVV